MTPRKALTVVLDTNFLLLPARFGVDIRAELERVVEASFVLAVTPAVLDELKGLTNKVKASEAKQVRLATEMSSRVRVTDDILTHGEDVDDQLLRLAVDKGYIVATTDAALRQRLRVKGLPVVFLRQGRHLAVEGLIDG